MRSEHHKVKKINKQTETITERGPNKEANTDTKNQPKRRKKSNESYARYIYNVLKQVQQDVEISSKAVVVMNSLITDIFQRIGMELYKLLKTHKSKTIKTRDVEAAVKLILPGELGYHAVNEGRRAIQLYYSHN